MEVETSLMLSLPQMIDLAIGSPETGAVNFNLLSAALHVMIQQMQLQNMTIEYKGPEQTRINSLMASAKPGLSLKVTEFVLDEDGTKRMHRTSTNMEIEMKDNTRSSKNGDRVIVVEKNVKEGEVYNIPHTVATLSAGYVKQLGHDVSELKQKMNEILELPNNSTLMEAVRINGDNLKPVIDMWQGLNLTKRVDAAEAGVNKIASMVEDLVREISSMGGTFENIGKEKADDTSTDKQAPRGSIFLDITNRLETLEQKFENFDPKQKKTSVAGQEPEKKKKTSVAGQEPEPEKKAERAETGSIEDLDLDTLQADLTTLKSSVQQLETEMHAIAKAIKGKNLAALIADIEEIKTKVGEQEEEQAGTVMAEELELKFTDIDEKLNNLDDQYSTQIKILENHLVEVEKELGELLERVNTTLATNEAADGSSMSDLFNKIVKLQEDLDGVTKATNKINEEQEERQLTMDQLIEQIELLKTAKADREDLEEALADKADTQHMNRKVSHDQFDAVCDDLTRGIEEAMQKLTQQEQLWQSTLDELQQTIGSKLDKLEFDPLRDFVNKKIKSLQARLKALIAMKAEQEAAGTKSKLLKDVNCISCDKGVIMYKENKFATVPAPAAMPGTRSMRPYITYELDAVRKQQRLLPQGRDMSHLESALKEAKPTKDKGKLEGIDKTTPAAHLCNRYCGGSHTVTSAHQRVAHIGHFLTQWGPQAIPLDETQIVGTDGQIYKSREGGAGAGDAVKSPRKSATVQTDEPKENVRRMSSRIEPTGRSKTIVVERKSSQRPSLGFIVEEKDDEPVKDQKGDEAKTEAGGEEIKERRPSSRLSVSRKTRRSSQASAIDQKSEEGIRRGSARRESKGSVSRVPQTSLKRISAAEVKRAMSKQSQHEADETVTEAPTETVPPSEDEEPSPPAAEETPADEGAPE